MANPKVWKAVAVAMQSAITAAVAITGISKASPGVVSTAGALPAVGDYVLLSNILGMSQVNNKVCRVSASGSGSFTLEGEDTTLYDTFTSGVFQKITFGNSITSMTTINSSGGDFAFIDTTTIHDTQRSQIPGLPNPTTFTFDNIWDPADTAQIELKKAADSQGQRAFKFTFGVGGPVFVFVGYVGSTLIPAGSAQALVTTPAVITLFGRPSYYAS